MDLEPLLAPGTETYRRWMKQLDTIADGLEELQRAGVVVLWRPFHEVNGDWFWWGAKKPETFIQVWRQMFDDFTTRRKLNNLLWVYGPNHGRKTALYYAGDAYVDIVGLDAYTDFVDPKHILGYPEVARLPKPFAFTEFGPHGPRILPAITTTFGSGMELKRTFPGPASSRRGTAKWGLGRNVNTRELLNHPWIVNRDDLPAEFAAGK